MGKTITKRLELVFSLKGASKVLGGVKKIAEGIFYIGNAAKMIVDQLKKVSAAFLDVAKKGDFFDKLSKRVGVNVEFLSEFAHVANLAGTEISALEPGFRRLAVNMQDMSMGIGEAKQSFETLGIDVKNSDGTLKSIDDTIIDIAGRFETMTNETQKLAIAQEIFGRGGSALLPILNQGSDAIRKQMKEAHELGISWTKLGTDTSAAFIDALTRLNGAWEGLKKNALLPLINALIPAFEKAAIKIGSIGTKISELPWEAMLENWQLVATAMGNILVIKLKEAWGIFADWMRQRATSFGGTATGGMFASVKKAARFWMGIGSKADFDKEVDDIFSELKTTLDQKQRDLLFSKKKTGVVEMVPDTSVPASSTANKLKDGEIAYINGDIVPMDIIRENKSTVIQEWAVYKPGEVTEEQFVKILSERRKSYLKDLAEQTKEDMLNMANEGASAFTALFDAITINANTAEKRTLNALTSIINTVPSALSAIQTIQAANTALSRTGGIFSLVGVGIGLIGSLIGNQEDEQEAADAAAAERKSRQYGSVVKGTPTVVNINPTITISGQVQYIAQEAQVFAQMATDFVVNGVNQAVSTGELDLSGAV